MNRTIIKKMLNAKKALNHTIQKILDINRQRKKRLHYENEWQNQQSSDDELRLLNKMAATQARIVQHYENMLNRRY